METNLTMCKTLGDTQQAIKNTQDKACPLIKGQRNDHSKNDQKKSGKNVG